MRTLFFPITFNSIAKVLFISFAAFLFIPLLHSMNKALTVTSKIGKKTEELLISLASSVHYTNDVASITTSSINLGFTSIPSKNITLAWDSQDPSTQAQIWFHKICFNEYTRAFAKSALKKSNAPIVGLGSLAAMSGGTFILVPLAWSNPLIALAGAFCAASAVGGGFKLHEEDSFFNAGKTRDAYTSKKHAFIFFSLSLLATLIIFLKYPKIAAKQFIASTLLIGGYIGTAFYYHRYMQKNKR